MTYKKKDTVEAIRWTENNFEEVKIFLGEINFEDENEILRNGAMRITTKHGYDVFCVGDYIIRQPSGALVSCRAEEFERTYEKVD